jgi:hypothetical protein
MKPLEILQNCLVATFVFPPLMVLTVPALIISRQFEEREEVEEYTEEEWNPTH